MRTHPLPPRPHGVIYADPPWPFAVRSPKGEGRSAKRHYATMTLADIKALPVADVAAPDCALFLWATDPMLPRALEVMAAWGFAYRSVGFVWAKLRRGLRWDHLVNVEHVKWDGRGGLWHLGLGYGTRANPELCLLGTRGAPKRRDKGVRRLIVAPVREHSRKPDEAAERIERLFPGPRLEMFARHARPGWDAWGDEAPVALFPEAAE